VPLALFAIPDSDAETNHFEISVPVLGSLILTHDPNGTIKGLKDFPKDQHDEAEPHHDAKGEERDRDRRPLVLGKILEALDRAVGIVGQDQAAQHRHRDLEVIGLRVAVGDGEEREWHTRSGFPMRLDRGQFGRLVFQRVEAVLIPDERSAAAPARSASHSVIENMVRASSMKRPRRR